MPLEEIPEIHWYCCYLAAVVELHGRVGVGEGDGDLLLHRHVAGEVRARPRAGVVGQLLSSTKLLYRLLAYGSGKNTRKTSSLWQRLQIQGFFQFSC